MRLTKILITVSTLFSLFLSPALKAFPHAIACSFLKIKVAFTGMEHEVNSSMAIYPASVAGTFIITFARFISLKRRLPSSIVPLASLHRYGSTSILT